MPKKPKSIPARVVGFFSSFGLAAMIFVLLAVLVLFGTLAQQHIGIHDVKRDYFSSAFVIHNFYHETDDGSLESRFAIPLIGGYPLMAVLFVNVLLGGLIRIRKRPQTIGVVISHFSMLILLAWGFVTNHFVDEGYVRIFEGQQEKTFTDYVKWDVEVVKETGTDARKQAYIIPQEKLALLGSGAKSVFENAKWPFEVEVTGYERNCRVAFERNAEPGSDHVDGYRIEQKKPEMRAEANVPGAVVTIKPKEGEEVRGLLSGHSRHPMSVKVGDDTWTLEYRRRIYELPYAVKLREFIKVDHPGISMAKRYMSDVTRIEGTEKDDVRIRMNHPMTSGQYTFYQADFGPKAEDPPGTPTYTVLAVWKRPLMAGQWPLIACIMVAAGLLIHFIMKLIKHFDRQGMKSKRAMKSAEPIEPESL